MGSEGTANVRFAADSFTPGAAHHTFCTILNFQVCRTVSTASISLARYFSYFQHAGKERKWLVSSHIFPPK